jgi:hypothetical protein
MPQPCYLITIANIQHFLIRTNNLLVFFDKKNAGDKLLQ